MFGKRITLLLGLTGAGKTEVAMAGALRLSRERHHVALLDLDVGSPSLLDPAARRPLVKHDIEVVTVEGPTMRADLPLAVARSRRVLADPNVRCLIALGDDAGSASLVKQLRDMLPDEVCARLLVVNFCRPFTRDADEATIAAADLAEAAGVRLDGIIANTHLMHETTPALVSRGYDLACETAQRLGLDVAAVTAHPSLCSDIPTQHIRCPVVALDGLGLSRPDDCHFNREESHGAHRR